MCWFFIQFSNFSFFLESKLPRYPNCYEWTKKKLGRNADGQRKKHKQWFPSFLWFSMHVIWFRQCKALRVTFTECFVLCFFFLIPRNRVLGNEGVGKSEEPWRGESSARPMPKGPQLLGEACALKMEFPWLSAQRCSHCDDESLSHRLHRHGASLAQR